MGQFAAVTLFSGLLLMATTQLCSAASEPPWSRNGLETGSQTVPYVVETLTPGAKRIGLTEAQLGSKVELRLVSAGLLPGNPRGSTDSYLYVRVVVVAEAFSCELQFRRSVEFVGAQNTRYSLPGASTWDRIMSGTHGGQAEYVVGVLDELLDQFLTDYLRANPK